MLATRHLWEPTWQALADYVLPRKGQITYRREEGSKSTRRLFDSAPIVANQLLAASLQGALTSDAFKWFRLKTRKQDLNDVKPVAEWLDEVADRMYLAFRQSNLSSQIQEVYLDLGCFGNGCLYIEEADSAQPEFTGFRFHYVQVARYTIAENKDGIVDTVFRSIRFTARSIVDQFGKESVGPKVSKWSTDDPDRPVYVVHAVYPRRPGDRAPGYKGKLPYASIYFIYGGTDALGTYDARGGERRIVQSGGLEYFPYMVPRWAKAADEVYGRGPGDTALPDIRTLNRAVELTLRAWGKGIDPPLKVRDDGVIGRVKVSPADLVTVRDMDAIQPLAPDSKSFQINEVKTEALRKSIKEIFFNQQLQLPEGQIMTATEVERRFELMQRFLGPTVGRITSELLNPMVQRAFHIMLRRGAIPTPPQELIGLDGTMEDIDIEYEGPLARAQRASDVQAIERTLQDVAALTQLDPNSKDNLDTDAITRAVAERNGVPPQFIRSVEQVAQLRDLRAKMAAEALREKQTTELLKASGAAVKGLAALPGVGEAEGG